jgi:hypothetical protein
VAVKVLDIPGSIRSRDLEAIGINKSGIFSDLNVGLGINSQGLSRRADSNRAEGMARTASDGSNDSGSDEEEETRRCFALCSRWRPFGNDLNRAAGTSAMALKRWQNLAAEAQILVSVRHPNIVTMMGSFPTLHPSI